MNYRRIEVISGLAAGLLGLLGLTYTLFGPTYSYQNATLNSDGTTSITSGTASLLEVQRLEPVTIVVFAVLLLFVAGVAVGAYLHSKRAIGAGRMLLGGSTALLGFGVVITGWSIGPSLLPCWLFALLAAAMADRVERQRRTASIGLTPG